MRKLDVVGGSGAARSPQKLDPAPAAGQSKPVESISTNEPGASNKSSFGTTAAVRSDAKSGAVPTHRRGSAASVNAFRGLSGIGERLKRGVSMALLGAALATNIAGCAREPTVSNKENAAEVYDTRPKAEEAKPPPTPQQLADTILSDKSSSYEAYGALAKLTPETFMSLSPQTRSQIFESAAKGGDGAIFLSLDGAQLRANPQAAAGLASTLKALPQQAVDWLYQMKNISPAKHDALSVLARTVALETAKTDPASAALWARASDAHRQASSPAEQATEVLSQSKGMKHLDKATAAKVSAAVTGDARTPLERAVRTSQLLENGKLGTLEVSQKAQLIDVALAAPAGNVGELNQLLSINDAAKQRGLMEPIFELQGNAKARTLLTELHGLTSDSQRLGNVIHDSLPEVKQQAMAKQMQQMQNLTPQQLANYEGQLAGVLQKDPQLAKVMTEAQSILTRAGGDPSKVSEKDQARLVELADVLDNSRPLLAVMSEMAEVGQANANAWATQAQAQADADAAQQQAYEQGRAQAQAEGQQAAAQQQAQFARQRQQDFRDKEAAKSVAYGVAGAALDQHARSTGSGAAAFGSGVAGALSVIHGVRAIRGY